MSPPSPESGFRFQQFRLLRARYQFDAARVEQNQQLTFNVGFGEDGKVVSDGNQLDYQQRLTVNATAAGSPGEAPVLTVDVQVQALFGVADNTTVTPTEFLTAHAPAIVLAFTRELVHRFTSHSWPIPPILLPPLDVGQLRQLPLADDDLPAEPGK